MSVLRIEEYGDVLKVILKPTKTFPVGYFYTDNNPIARELVESYSWLITKHSTNIYVVAHIGTYGIGQKNLYFHQEYTNKILGYYPDYLDHINGLEIDNRDINLNVVSQQQNMRNRPSRGYQLTNQSCLQPYYVSSRKTYYKGSFKTEPEALIATYNLRQEMYSDYNYNFYLDRRNDEDIVDLELTGKISSDEAIYLHVKRYAGTNPWYIYRYNLFDYCSQHNIVIPSFELDAQGFMIHPVTKQRLCPY